VLPQGELTSVRNLFWTGTTV